MSEELFVIPASFAQQRFWFLDQLEPGNPAYNIPAAFSLEGRLDTTALERSLNEVVRRHEALRTAFALVDGQPMQLIAPSRKLEVPVIDLQHMGADEREARVREAAAEEARRGFDLREGPLLRASVLRLGAEAHVLLLTLHHIVADAWSVGVLVRELAALYAAYGKGEESPLPELSVQYADYAVWQRERLTATTLESQLAYWKRQLAGAPTVLELPADRPRAAVGGFRGAKQSFKLSAGLSTALRRLSQSEGATLFMTLLAGFNLLLQRYTGQDDILVGTPIAGRTRPETKDIIGLFVNTLVLRTGISGDPTFRELLARVRATAVEAYAHQEVPFERLVEELQVERSLSHSPLFQVMFALNNTPQEEFQLPGLRLTRIDTESDTAKFDLTLTLLDEGESLTGTLKYNSDLFEPATISRMLTHWERLLAGIAASPQTPVSALPLLTPDEERQLLVEWNRTQTDVAPATLHELFEAQARRTPEAVALADEQTRLSYAELNARANRLARRLRASGVGSEAVVGVLLERSAEMVVALLGVLKAGAAYLPLDPAYPAERTALLLADAGAVAVLTQRSLAEAAAGGGWAGEVVCVEEVCDGDEADGNGEDLGVEVCGDNLAYVIYTSGSTGLPKGVQIEHRQLVNYVHGILERLRLPAGCSFATVSTLAADLGNTAIYPALCTGGQLHVISQERVADAEALADYCSRHPYDCLKIVPSHLQALLDSPRAKQVLPLRRLILGGEACSWALIDKVRKLAPDCVIVNHYGPTEATIGALTYGVAKDSSERPAQNPPLGRPLPNVRVYLLDKQLRPVPVGVRGELYIGGDGLARGYARRPRLTAERFIPDPFSGEPGRRLYRTGDAARYLPGGDVEFLGRVDNQLKLRGYRVEPGEIEAVLRGHPSIREAAVVAHEDGSGDKWLAAYVVAEAQSPALQAGDLRDFLKGRLPAYMIPSAYVLLESMPLTANGKVDRKALAPPERGAAPPAGSPAAAVNPVEGLLRNIWAELLRLEEFGADDNFFDLGGHSLLATQVISRVREAFGVEIPLRTLFERPTVAEFARALEAALRREPETHSLPLVPVTGDGERPMSFAQQRLWFLDRLQPGSAFYNLPGAVRLTGELDLTALERSLQEVVRRHEVLRFGFDSVEGRPVPAATPQAHLHLPVTSLAGLPADEREAEARRLLLEEAERPFDLAKGPMLRVQLLRLAPQSHLLLVTMHHIAADGWSVGIFIRELTACYEAFTQGKPAALPELKVQYADYAHWQRQRLQGGFLDRDLLYWKEQLAGAPALLALPLDRPRPAVQSFRGALRSFTLPPDLGRELQAFSRREGVTLFMTLLAAFKVLLARYSGQHDIVVGTPVSGRNHVATEGLIGFFVNMLVLRTDLGDDPTASELLRRVREVALGAYAHQEVPFERLVEELQPERSLSHSPLFQVMFALNNTPRETLKLPHLEVSLVNMSSETAKYDLTFALDENPEGLRLKVEYNTDLFDHETIDRMVGHYQRLLAGIAASPQTPVSALPLLTPDEERQLLVEWNRTQTDVAPATLHELFEAQARRTPEAVALAYEQTRLSYAELNARANGLARRLRASGVGSEAVVGVLLERSAEMVVALLGVLKAGAAYLPLDPAYPAERIGYLMRDAGVALVLTQSGLERLVSGAQTLCLDVELGAEEEGLSTENLRPAAHADDLAYVIYTSGSTGRPKGVAVSHRNVVNFFAGMDQRIGSDGPQTWLALTSISFDISVLELFWTLTRGHKVVIQGQQRALSSSGAGFGGAQDREMQFSLFYFASDDSLGSADSYRLLIEGAKFADRNGFTAVWTPERHFHAFGGLYANPSVTSAAIAAVTERVQIRAGSVVIPLHEPIRVAEEWAMVDNISRGRVAVSFASGWHANDFALAPEIYQQRHEVMYRNIETVRRLWRGESIVRRDGAGKEIELRIHPRPVQPELPIWLTAAGSPETFKTAGRMGANMLTHLLGQTVEELADKIALYRAAWREHGHGPGAGHVTLMLHTFISDDLEEVRRTVRGPFSNYLRSSVSLLRNSARSLGRDIDSSNLNEEDMQAILAHAFDRYFETSALLGTPESCLRMIERLKAVGVDEVGCLIDFGVADEEVLSNLPQLNLLRQRSNARPGAQGEDYSIAAQISRHGVTHLQCTPSLARMLLAEPEAAGSLQSLKALLVGGEALPATLAQQLRRTLPGTLHNMYGPTETTIWSTTYQVERVEGSVAIGKPIANTTTRILDARGRPVPVGVVGELYIGGSGVARGYLHLPALTAERFVPDPFATEPGARMYRTGDLARYLPDGNIEFHGRVDHQVKINGHRIEPGEIEALLRQYQGVSEAVVLARDDAAGESRLLAYVVPAEDVDARRLQMVAAPEATRLLGDRPHFKLPNGMVVSHPSGHRATVLYHEIFENESYLRHGITLRDGDCVFDVGANVGMFTLFANHKRKDLKLYAFEPIPQTFDTLKTNVALYGLDAKLFNLGLGSRPGAAEFTFYPRMPGLSGRFSSETQDKEITKAIIEGYLREHGSERERAILSDEELNQLMEEYFQSETYTCPLTTLSEVIREHKVERIDLLKVDVEKSEFDVLSGLAEEDWAKVRQIVMEVDTRELLAQISALLERHQFDFTTDEIVSVEKGAAGAEVHVYMLYAVRRGQQAADGVQAAAHAGEALPRAGGGGALSVVRLRRYLQDKLPPHMIPSAFTLLPALPLTPNGKIDLKALPEPTELAPELAATYVAPETKGEQIIAQVWRDVLKVAQVGVNDNFFEAGGTSLRLVEVNSRLREAFKRSIPVVEMFRHPTISDLARYLEADEAERPNFAHVQERASKAADVLHQQRQAAARRRRGARDARRDQ